MAPQTIDMQSTGGSYFQLALTIKDILTVVNTQYYNSGTMLGCDGKATAQGTVDFLTALACIQLEGGLRPGPGRPRPAGPPARPAAGWSPRGGQQRAGLPGPGHQLRHLPPAATYPGIRGAMTWSINWDQVQGYAFANTVAPALDRLP